MKKKLLIALFAITAAICGTFGFAACGDKTDNSGNGGNSGNTEQSGNTQKPDDGQVGNSGHKHNYTQSVTPPTCYSQGYITYTCSCGNSYIDNYTDALGHNYVNGKCIHCNNFQPTEGLSYGLSYDKTYAICAGLDEVTATEIVISSDYNGKPVTQIGDRAFSNSSSLTDVMIPDSVTEIGYQAFYNCRSLTGITIPDEVTSIGESAFGYCSSLTSITIPDSVKYIGKNAFGYCSSLTEINFKDIASYCQINGLENISKSKVYIGEQKLTEMTSIIIPDSVTKIGSYAFYDCDSLKNITIPDSVTEINSNAFYHCNSLTNVTIGNSLTSISNYAFRGCSSLTSINIPNSVTFIGQNAFGGCSSLSSITIPDEVNYIAIWAFSGCNKLIQKENGVSYVDKWVIECETSVTEVTLRNNTKGIANSAFQKCCSLKNIPFPNSLTYIGSSAFRYCSSLTSITIPDSVTSIGWCAFEDCGALTEIKFKDMASYCQIGELYYVDENKAYIGGQKLTEMTSIVIPDGVTSIGEGAFRNCSSLTSVTIPDSVTKIGESAFHGCSSLTNIVFKNTNGWFFTYDGKRASIDVSNFDLIKDLLLIGGFPMERE